MDQEDQSHTPGNPPRPEGLPGPDPRPEHGGFRPLTWLKRGFRWFFAWDFAAWFVGGLLLFLIVSLLWPQAWDPTPPAPPLPAGICTTCQGLARFTCPDCAQGFTSTGLSCTRCQGRGWLPCPACDGSGRAKVGLEPSQSAPDPSPAPGIRGKAQ